MTLKRFIFLWFINSICQYSFSQQATVRNNTSGNTTLIPLTIKNSFVVSPKKYNGDSTATVIPGQLSGQGTDDVYISKTEAYFNTSQARSGLTVTAKYTLGGKDSGKYLPPPDDIFYDKTISPYTLAVSDPYVYATKEYDGYTTAKATPGVFLTKLFDKDAGKVSLVAIAKYNDARVKYANKITVTYTLSGLASANYAIPPDYKYEVAGSISPCELKIKDIDVDKNKMVDGNQNAKVTNQGTFINKFNSDIVNHTVTAHYYDALVGENKKIAVNVDISGNDVDNYTKPEVPDLTECEISDYISINDQLPSLSTCENAVLVLDYSVKTGKPTQYKITYDDKSTLAGLQSIGYTNTTSTGNGSIILPVTQGISFGNYSGTVQFKNKLGIESPVYPFNFKVNITNNDVLSKYGNVVFIDNSSNQFMKYQWYKIDKGSTYVNKIAGATKQFYRDPMGLVGTYYAEVITINKDTFLTCAKDFNEPIAKSVQVLPGLVIPSQPFKVCIAGYTEQELAEARIEIFNSQGLLIYRNSKITNSNNIQLTNYEGVYFGHLVTDAGDDLQFKIMISK